MDSKRNWLDILNPQRRSFLKTVSAGTAVATIRTTQRNELFAPETHATVTTVTGVHLDARLIDEFHLNNLCARRKNEKPRARRG